MDENVVKVGAIGCVVFLVLGGVAAGAVVFAYRNKSVDETSSSTPEPGLPELPSNPNLPRSPHGNQPNQPSHDHKAHRNWSRPLQTADRAHVDLKDLMPQAVAVATELQPGAKMVGINAFGLHGGTFDLDHLEPSSPILYEFEFLGVDKAQPPGKDKVEVTISVRVTATDLEASASPGGVMHLSSPDFFGGELPTPKCSSKKAFATAVANGVPENTVGRFMYTDNHKSTPKSPIVWRLYVDGHDDYGREIDAKTCEIAKKGDEKAGGKHHKHKKH